MMWNHCLLFCVHPGTMYFLPACKLLPIAPRPVPPGFVHMLRLEMRQLRHRLFTWQLVLCLAIQQVFRSSFLEKPRAS